MNKRTLTSTAERTARINAQWRERERKQAAALVETPVVDATGAPLKVGDLVTYWSELYRVQTTGRVTEISPGWKYGHIESAVERFVNYDNLTVRAYALNESGLLGVPGAAAQWIHGCKAREATTISDPLKVAQWELGQAEIIVSGIDAEELALGIRRRRAERELEAAQKRAQAVSGQ